METNNNLPKWVNDLLEDERHKAELKQMINEVETENKIIQSLTKQAEAMGYKLEDVTHALDYKKMWSESIQELNRRHEIIRSLSKENNNLKEQLKQNETTI